MLLKNKIIKFLLFIFLSKFQITFGQERIISETLKKNKVGKTYSYNYSSKENGYSKINVSYLGQIKTTDKKFKILTWARIWGENRHTSGIVYVYDLKNHYIGKYYLGSSSDLPCKVENCYLIFNNNNKSDCDIKLITKIDFTNEIPKEIFLKCKGDAGDIYSFSEEK